jgi:hypothetical protein
VRVSVRNCWKSSAPYNYITPKGQIPFLFESNYAMQGVQFQILIRMLNFNAFFCYNNPFLYIVDFSSPSIKIFLTCDTEVQKCFRLLGS